MQKKKNILEKDQSLKIKDFRYTHYIASYA